MKIFYHSDMDGKCAAHIVLLFNKLPIDMQTCQAINYGIDFPFDLIQSGERVYIVDFSIEPSDMHKLRAITDDIVWIDHHKSAIEKYASFPIDIAGLRSIDKAGCELTWEYFSSKEAPEYVKLIGDRDTWNWQYGDRDTWNWQYGDRSKFFHAGLESGNTNPDAAVWDLLVGDDYTEYLIREGGTIQKYIDYTEQEYIKENGFEIEFHGYTAYAVNGRFSSQPFEVVAPDAQIWLTFRYMKGSYWMVSLYTNKDVDVAQIACQYVYRGKQGGGHKQAAGYECYYPKFLAMDIIDPDKLMELEARE